MLYDPRKLLHDVASRAASIRAYMRGKNFATYDADEILRLAVERQNEIIGEALSRLVKDDPRLVSRIADYRKIIDFRNAITHGYDLIDNQLVWDAVSFKLPVLEQEAAELLAELS